MLHKIHHVIRNLPTIWYMSVSCICIGHADLSPLSHTTYMSPHLGLVNSHYYIAAYICKNSTIRYKPNEARSSVITYNNRDSSQKQSS